MKKRFRAQAKVSVKKVVRYAVIMNGVEIVASLLLIALSLARHGNYLSEGVELFFLLAMTAIVAGGAIVDIREALSARRAYAETDMLEDANEKLSDLNDTLRAQRHDFMNHLQVVYSLLEMDEQKDALKYIDHVYADIQRVGKTLKTAVPAVNALLAAKVSDCERHGIRVELNVHATLAEIPLSGWALCRVLGNLIDNAIEVLKQVKQPRLKIEIGESFKAYSFAIENNGPDIPRENLERIFQIGFTTKSAGHGMGLAIVIDVLHEGGGDIRVTSEGGITRFEGTIPKTAQAVPEA
jgi:sensor histidine kinase regulating citrate/malate metabolism